MSPYIPRYPGPRWSIRYGTYEGIEKFALEELNRAVQAFLPYVVRTRPAGGAAPLGSEENVILVGTPENNPEIQELVQRGVLRLPEHPEGYTLAGLLSPWAAGRSAAVIAGCSPAGVLYGVEAFNARVLSARLLPEKRTPAHLRRALDEMGDFNLPDYPRVHQRGIWTWGFVLYDYPRFLDAMARLRFNALTIWNDTPPLNCREVIDYAHSRGVRVVLGFPWGWGRDYDLKNPADLRLIEEEVLQHYQTKIAPLQPDGIYFQTLTEHDTTQMDGRSVAARACELVNRVAARLYQVTPGLNIQFGLHATSIREHYGDLRALDPRVTIVWEDAGALPYTYLPTLEYRGSDFQQTLDYSLRLAAIRPGAAFGLIPKGWTNLDWMDEFEHHEEFLLGVRGPAFIRQRLELIQPRWARVNALWLEHYPKAVEFYRALLTAGSAPVIAQGLIEDGLLEERIQPAVALFAETLWNPFDSPAEILSRAQSPYYLG